MSTLFSDSTSRTRVQSVSTFAFPEIAPPDDPQSVVIADAIAEDEAPVPVIAPPGPSPAEVDATVRRARAEAVSQTELRCKQEYEQRLVREGDQIRQALDAFAKERGEYFTRVEAEVVHLALAIARKILHRESQVDPTLLAALVRMAVEHMNAGSDVSVRVRPEESAHWRTFLNQGSNDKVITVIEDQSLNPGSCVLETQMGSTDFSFDAQLKEVEHGFLDLLAQRPA